MLFFRKASDCIFIISTFWQQYSILLNKILRALNRETTKIKVCQDVNLSKSANYDAANIKWFTVAFLEYVGNKCPDDEMLVFFLSLQV